ncbi:MAG: hypothetical protein LUF02_08110 [Erysipelotrichaceae bacterium]|nr:hypothetical protein [Erysipelotrichaceae bacterium]
MKYLKILICIFLSLNIVGCSQSNTTSDSDFWIDTIDTIENTTYDEDKWDINVLSVEYAQMAGDDTTYRSAKIAQDEESETLSITTSFSLSNDDNDKSLIYTYQRKDILNSDNILNKRSLLIHIIILIMNMKFITIMKNILTILIQMKKKPQDCLIFQQLMK